MKKILLPLLLTASLAALFSAQAGAVPQDDHGPGGPGGLSYTQCYEIRQNIDYFRHRYLQLANECRSYGDWASCDAAAQAYDLWHQWYGAYFGGQCFGYPLDSGPNPDFYERTPRPLSTNP